MHAPFDAAPEQAGFFEDADVFGDCRLRERKLRCNLADGERPACEPFDDAPARGIGECSENRIEIGVHDFRWWKKTLLPSVSCMASMRQNGVSV